MAIRTQEYSAVVKTPFGHYGIIADDEVTAIDFLGRRGRHKKPASGLVREVYSQLRAYFSDPLHRFDLPLRPAGSVFDRRVWRALRTIPAGKVLSYGELAKRLDTAARAVGGACRRNPIPIIIPCHRVIAKNGMGGFMGQTKGTFLQLKQRLLAHEATKRGGI